MSSQKLILVVAATENGVIGRENHLPWRLATDLQYFKTLTSHSVILMGRKTYNTFTSRLPNRIHIVVTSKNDLQDIDNELYAVHSIEEGITLYEKFFAEKKIFLIGGGQLYAEALQKNLVQKIHFTEIKTVIEGDTYFKFDKNDWKVVDKKEFKKDEKNEYDFDILEMELK
jgi:dihydrofolate reductase